MVQTALFKEILKRANEVKAEFNAEHLAASHIAVAVTDFCAMRYTGHTPIALQSSSRFEEERLRYIFSKEIRVASYFRIKLSCNTKAGVQEKAFDIGCCDRIASLSKNSLLTADILFLSALKELDNAYRPAARNIVSEDRILAALEDADKNVYDFVIEKIEAICSELKEKADAAKAIRDWKPAEKFAEPEDLVKQFIDNIRTACEDNVLYITIPGFLRKTDLKLSIYKANDHFVVHDNGCAVKSLSKQIDSIRIQKVLDLLWDKSNLQDNKLFTQITDIKSVLYFIQEVILTANADLYYEYFKEEIFEHRRYIEPCKVFENEQQAEDFDANAILNTLKETVTAFYDENKGITLCFDTKYCHCSYGIKVLIETLDDGTVRFSDAYKNKQYETGEMLEAFYSGSAEKYDDMYYKVMQELAKPFGITIDMTSSIVFPEYNGRKHNHKNPYMLSTAPNWVRDFCKFMNCAVLISVVVDRINYEKVRQW
jgi:hypothetical protein